MSECSEGSACINNYERGENHSSCHNCNNYLSCKIKCKDRLCYNCCLDKSIELNCIKCFSKYIGYHCKPFNYYICKKCLYNPGKYIVSSRFITYENKIYKIKESYNRCKRCKELFKETLF